MTEGHTDRVVLYPALPLLGTLALDKSGPQGLPAGTFMLTSPYQLAAVAITGLALQTPDTEALGSC